MSFFYVQTLCPFSLSSLFFNIKSGKNQSNWNVFVFAFICISCSWSSSFQNSKKQQFQNIFFIPYHISITLVTTKLTNLEELSFRTVFALPNVSKTGLVCTTWSSRLAFLMFPSLYSLAPTVAKFEMTFLVFSVFPAPDSPLKLHFILYYIQTKIVIEPESWSKKPNSVSTQDSACL